MDITSLDLSDGASTGVGVSCTCNCSYTSSTCSSSASTTSPLSPSSPWLPCEACVQVAHLKLVAGADHLLLALHIQQDPKTFFRAVDEKLDKLRARLELVVNGPLFGTTSQSTSRAKKKKLKKKTSQQQQEQKQAHTNQQNDVVQANAWTEHDTLGSKKQRVVFYDREHQEINGKRTLGDALWHTKYFEIGTTKYFLLKNEPQILHLRLVEPLLQGIPAAPFGDTEFCELDQCHWKWFRVASCAQSDEAIGDHDRVCVWTKRIYTPTCKDIGCRFVVQCLAPCTNSIYAHESSAELFTTKVLRGPDRQVFRARQSLAARCVSDCVPAGFRVMSYNVLFDGYTTTEQATKTLFPYAKAEFMQEMYRMQLVFQEIAESRAQIVCLQEMGAHVFENFFKPMVQTLGYKGMYANKTGTTQEGCAILIQTRDFDLVEDHVLELSKLVLTSSDPIVQRFVKEYREIRVAFERIPSVAQLIVLRSRLNPSRAVILANTHLFYREDAHVIRLLQTAVLVRAMEHLKQRLESDFDQIGVILAGDLNAFPQTDAVQFLQTGCACKQQTGWAQACEFQWKRHSNTTTSSSNWPAGSGSSRSSSSVAKQHRQVVLPGTLRHSLNFESACGIPEFTNFAATFIGTLDYIWIGREALHVAQVFPFFTRQQVEQEVALPSSQFPSDHISLLCDVAWN